MTLSLYIFARLLILLFAAHIVCDLTLQDGMLSSAKRRVGNPDIPWYVALSAHSTIHSAAVLLITGSLPLALIEFVAHFVIDYAKCEGDVSLKQDQIAHVLFKVGYAMVIVTGVA